MDQGDGFGKFGSTAAVAGLTSTQFYMYPFAGLYGNGTAFCFFLFVGWKRE